MEVHVNDSTITNFNLDEVTGLSREELLRQAREASEKGEMLIVRFDANEMRHNIFDSFESTPAMMVDMGRPYDEVSRLKRVESVRVFVNETNTFEKPMEE